MNAQPSEGRFRSGWEWTLVILGGFTHVALSPHYIDSDGVLRFQSLEQLVTLGRLSPERYSLVQSILAIPLWAVGQLVGRPKDAVAFFNPLILLLALYAIWRLLRREISGAWLRAFLLLVLGASMFPRHSQHFYGEVLTALSIFLGLLLQDKNPVLGGAAIALGVVNTPAAALGVALAAVERFRTRRRLAVFLPVAVGAVLVLAEFWVRRRSFASGYEGDHGVQTFMPYSGKSGFSYPLILGLIAQLLSFGKGILFFAPGLLLVFSRARFRLPRSLAVPFRESLLVVLGLLLIYSKWWAWYGGWFWGPRFLLFAAFPASMLLASEVARPARNVRRAATALVLVALSVWVGASGSIFGLANSDLCLDENYRLEVLCHFTLEWSPLVRPFIDPAPMTAQRWALAAWFALAGATLVSQPLVTIVRGVRRHCSSIPAVKG